MALTIPGDLQTALNAQERYGVILFTFFLAGGTYGFWNISGEGSYGGYDYVNGASLLQVGDIQYAGDGSVAEYTLTLSTQPDKGLTADILQTFYDEGYHQRDVTFQLGMRNPATGAIYGVVMLASGKIMNAPFTKGKSGDKIELRIASHAIQMGVTDSQYRNSATQVLIDATDTSLKDIGIMTEGHVKELKWNQG